MSKKKKESEPEAGREPAKEEPKSAYMQEQVVPVAEVEKIVNVSEYVMATLQSDPSNAYPVSALVISAFSVKEDNIPSLQKDGTYTRMTNQVRNILRRLGKAGKISEGRKGPTKVYYWSAGVQAPAATVASA